MTLTNTRTILRQIGARGMAPGYISNGSDVKDDEFDVEARSFGYRLRKDSPRISRVIERYTNAIRDLGGVSFVTDLANHMGITNSSCNSFTRSHPDLFIRTEIKNEKGICYLIELRNK